jgi:hypothetical protein
MSIETEFQSTITNVKNAYQGLNNLGATIPQNKNIENIKSCLDEIYDNLPKTEYQEGTSVTLEGLKGKIDFDTDNGKKIVGYGDTQQTQYSGYNLFAEIQTQTLNGMTITKTDNGYILNGTTTANTTFRGTISSVVSSKKSIGAKCSVAITNADVQVKTRDSAYTQLRSISLGTANTWVVGSGTYEDYYCDIFIRTGVTLSNILLQPMLLEGTYTTTNIPNYEPYVGGIASPNPSYPQDIKCVTGNQDVVESGKNLFDIGTSLDDWFQTSTNGTKIGSATVTIATGTISNNKLTIDSYNTSGWNWISKWITLGKNTDYIISGTNDTSITVVGFTSNKLQSTGTGIVSKSSSESTKTFNSGDYAYYCLSMYPSGTGKYIENIQIETGNQATPYEPYHTPITYPISLGSKQLYDECYIVGSPDNWKFVDNMYKTKLKDIQLYGGWSVTQSNNLYYFWFVYESMYGVPKGKMLDNNGDLAPIFSNYFGHRNVFYNVNTEKNVIVKNTQPTSPMFIVAVDGEIASSVAEWKNYIANHEDLYIVYSTKNQIETPITDETLISQLNAWYNAHSNNGTTIIESNGDLPMIIKVRALKGE